MKRAHHDLAQQVAALRAALPYDVAPEITLRENDIEVLVYEEKNVARIRRVAREVGIPEEILRLIRPVFFLHPYPGDDARNDAAWELFQSKNIRMNSDGSGVQLTSMDPIVGHATRTLVLGSMPGDISLQAGEYYSNRNNRFWRVMASLLDLSDTAPYPERIAALERARVGLWDVLRHCSRAGSLDSAILPDTEIPNDIAGVLERHPNITRIVFNGQKAAGSFSRLVAPALPHDIRGRIRTTVAPSTSAANARLTLPSLVAAWRAAFNVTA